MLLSPGGRPYDDTRRFADGFEFDTAECIGRGATSSVYYGFLSNDRKRTGRKLAVKVIKASDETIQKACEEELNILKRLEGIPCMIQLLGSSYDEGCCEYQFAMELGKSVKVLLSPGNIRYFHGLSQYLLTDLIQDLVSAMSTLHKMRILHRDIKPDNVLCFHVRDPTNRRKSDACFKLCDFGCSKEGVCGTTMIGTPGYMNPNIISRYPFDNGNTIDKRYGDEVDLWSLGCTIVECATAQMTFPTTPIELYQKCVVEIPVDSDYICASFDFETKQIKYSNQIKNESYPLWFRHVLKEMVLLMFDKPSSRQLGKTNLEQLEAMVEALVKAKESSFVVLGSSFVHKSYAFFPGGIEQGNGYPSLEDELNLTSDFGCCHILSSGMIGSLSSFECIGNRTYVVIAEQNTLIENQQPEMACSSIRDGKLASLIQANMFEERSNTLKKSIKEALHVLESNTENMIQGYNRFGGLRDLLQRLTESDFVDSLSLLSANIKPENLVWKSIVAEISSAGDPISYPIKFVEQVQLYSEVILNFVENSLENLELQESTEIFNTSYEMMGRKDTELYAEQILNDSTEIYRSLLKKLTTNMFDSVGFVFYFKILKWIHELIDRLQAAAVQSSSSLTQSAEVFREVLIANQLTTLDAARAARETAEGAEEEKEVCLRDLYNNLQQLQELFEMDLTIRL